jgi:hypothetical protein
MSSDLQIIEQRTMVAIPRGDDELRVQFVRGRTSDGKEVCWHSLRVFWKDGSGEWKPGKQGITIRGRELAPVAEALSKACSGGRS